MGKYHKESVLRCREKSSWMIKEGMEIEATTEMGIFNGTVADITSRNLILTNFRKEPDIAIPVEDILTIRKQDAKVKENRITTTEIWDAFGKIFGLKFLNTGVSLRPESRFLSIIGSFEDTADHSIIRLWIDPALYDNGRITKYHSETDYERKSGWNRFIQKIFGEHPKQYLLLDKSVSGDLREDIRFALRDLAENPKVETLPEQLEFLAEVSRWAEERAV